VYRSSRVLGTKLDAYYDLWQDLNSRINEVFSSIKTVILSGSQEREWDHFKKQSQKAYDTAYWRSRRENWYLFWQEFLVQCSRVMVFGLGCYRVFEHQLTPGDVVMFVAYISEIYGPVETLSGLGITIQERAASFGRALRLLKEPGTQKKGELLHDGPGRLEFNDVHFGYTQEREVLQGVSLILRPGAITGLVGPSGAGKTTLADLVLHLYEPKSGIISIDGQNLAGIDVSSLRSAIAVVAADGAVFGDTLLDNIRYKRPHATLAEVQEAARMAGLDKTIQRLPHGLKTEIGERGMGLSVGERQRLQIARALVSRPRLLILDEATANLDFATEREVKEAIETMRGRLTSLVIAHRYSMVRNADFVYVLDNGVIAESGTPAALLMTGGWFSRLAGNAREKESA
jgi:ATP-binding cassette, subfamily B, bacterial